MRRILAAGLAGVLLVACTSGGDDDADPVPTTEAGPTTSAIDRSGIALAGVEGSTTTTIAERGTARLVGSVRGPAGAVPGATVRVERLVGGRELRTDVATGADGTFVLEGVPGGRYRVRAFLAPTMVQLQPEVRFLADGKEHRFDLVVEEQGGLAVLADATPDIPFLDEPVNVVAVVLSRTVDADGVLRAVPVADLPVQLTGLGRWNVLRSADAPTTTTTTRTGLTTSTLRPTTTTTTRAPSTVSTRTDGAGRVRFELRCDAPGAPGLALLVPERYDLALPACVDPATTTTTVAPPTTTDSSTTTAAPG